MKWLIEGRGGGGGQGGGGRLANFHQFNNTAFQISADLAFNFYTHFLFQVQPGAIFQSHFPDFAFKIAFTDSTQNDCIEYFSLSEPF